MMKIEKGHRESRQEFQQNPGLILIKICDEEAKIIRKKARDKKNRNSMRRHGDQFIVKEVQISSVSVKEITIEIDVEKEKEE